MNNKLFWPIVLVSVVIIIESVLLLSNNRKNNPQVEQVSEKNIPTQTVKKADPVVGFSWVTEGEKTFLEMKANKDVAIDAIDLYIGYRDVKVNSVKNVGDLPKPSFSKISTEKSLVVLNYLIAEADGFKMKSGQVIRVVELDFKAINVATAQFLIDPKTQVVENGSAKVLPY